MSNNFLPDDPTELPPGKERLQVFLIGSSAKAIDIMIQNLQSVGYASTSEWSCLLPGPKPGQVMSILKRYLTKDN